MRMCTDVASGPEEGCENARAPTGCAFAAGGLWAQVLAWSEQNSGARKLIMRTFTVRSARINPEHLC